MARNSRFIRRSFAGGEVSVDMFGRTDDSKLQAGAARIENMVCRPQGPVVRRPGTEHVVATKDNRITRLLPFVYSNAQSYVIEMGARQVTTQTNLRDIGFFRFHTNGQSLLYTQPAAWVADQTISGTPGSPDLTITSHPFNTGDPVALTMNPNQTFTGWVTGTDYAVDVTSPGVGLFAIGQEVSFAGNVPPEIELNKLYYVVAISGNTLAISERPGGTAIQVTTTPGAPRNISALPAQAAPDQSFRCLRIYYAIDTGPNTVALADTYLDALNGNNIAYTVNGTGARKLQYAYVPGDLVLQANETHYCMRRPWGEPGDPYMWPDYHGTVGTPGSSGKAANYWMTISGSSNASVTFGSDKVTWASHGLVDGDPVVFSGGSLPAEITAGVVYYAVDTQAVGSFSLSTTPFGTRMTISGGSGTGLANAYYEVPHIYGVAEMTAMTFAQSNDVLTLATPTMPAMELRREEPTRWVLQPVDPAPPLAAPADPVAETVYRGEGITISTMSGTAARRRLNFAATTSSANAPFAELESVYLEEGCDAIAAGYYRVYECTTTYVELIQIEGGAHVGSAGTVVTGTPRVFSVPTSSEIQQTYQVTTVSEDGLESGPSPDLVVDNNLFVPGAYTDITWGAVSGAERYRIYKKNLGVFGYIGETLDNTFRDDNIGPDLSITPPIRDVSLYSRKRVTAIDTTNNVVTVPDHGFSTGMLCVFDTNDTLPGLLTADESYYIKVRDDSSFELYEDANFITQVNLTGGAAGETWVAAGDFPSAVGYFEQRRAFGGSYRRPQQVRLTASGSESDMTYSIPTVDADRILVEIASRERSGVRHIVALDQLLFLCESSEVRVTPINDDALTPASVAVRPQSYIGSRRTQPAVVNNVVVFSSERGGHVRELGFSDEINGYLSGDLSIRATHLFDNRNVTELGYARAPYPTLWCLSDDLTDTNETNRILSLTYVPEENIGAWTRHTFAGGFPESLAVVPEDTEDRVYVVINRSGTRYIERFGQQEQSDDIADAYYVDSGGSYIGGPALSVVWGFRHLAGQTVNVLVDGIASTAVVAANGSVTLPNAGVKVSIGLPVTATIETVPFSVLNMSADGYGRQKNICAAHVRVSDSGTFSAGPTASNLVTATAPAAGSLESSEVEIVLPGSWTDDGGLVLQTSTPLPLQVSGMVLEVTFGG